MNFETQRGSRWRGKILAGAVALGLAALGGLHLFQANGRAGGAAAVPDLPPATRAAASDFLASGSFAPLVKRAAPAVVSVQSTRTERIQEMPFPFPFPFPFGPEPSPGEPREQERRQRGVGSGVIISPDGYILTNHHVIDGAEDVRVQLSDEREFTAKVVGSDAKTDIAVLKVEATGLPAMPLGNSEAIEVGDIVLAIGNPFGLGQTVTMGIVGATGRQFGIMAAQAGYEDFIQTDAAINPGNSGGALIDTQGRLIGINTAILSRSGGNQGVGFAVPVNLAHHVTRQLIEHGSVRRGYMGVGIQDITPAMSKTLKAPDSRGAVVTSVEPSGPAAKAGFEQYDIIRSIDGREVRDTRELRLLVASIAPGKAVKVDILRDGQPKTLTVTLAEFPGEETAEKREGRGQEGALDGVAVEALTPQLAQRLGIDRETAGVVVTRVRGNSKAAEAGLRTGDVIREVNRQPVRSPAEFRAAMGKAAKDEPVLLLVETRGASRFIVVEP